MNCVDNRTSDWPTIAETITLRHIRQRGWTTVKDMAFQLDKAPATLHEQCKKLETKRYIARRSSPHGYEFGVTFEGGQVADLAADLEIGETE